MTANQPTEDQSQGTPAEFVAEAVASLHLFPEIFASLHKQIISEELHPFDLFLNGITQRSISLTLGFCSMIEARNPFCALALIRMQLDTLMRLYGCTLVEDVPSLVLHVLRGGAFNKWKSRDGQLLRDVYLREELAKKLDWVNHVYEMTSGFIHLSERHFFPTVSSATEDGKCTFFISKTNPEWNDGDILGAIHYFTKITNGILELYSLYDREKWEAIRSREELANEDEPSA